MRATLFYYIIQFDLSEIVHVIMCFFTKFLSILFLNLSSNSQNEQGEIAPTQRQRQIVSPPLPTKRDSHGVNVPSTASQFPLFHISA